jgi:hypothetical protein
VDRLGDVLQLSCAEVGDLEIEPSLHLPVGLFGKADRSRFGDTFQPRGDINAVAHQIAVAFLDDVADVDPDTEFDPLFSWHTGVALDHRALDFDGAAHFVDDAAELDDDAVAGARNDPPMVERDGRVNKVAAEPPQTRQSLLLFRAASQL